MVQTVKYARKTFEIDAVQVTDDNIQEVAEWCSGEVRERAGKDEESGKPYVKVRVFRPLNERQTRAYVGDWVLFAGTGYKVYSQKAFENCFEPVQETATA